MMMMMVMVMVMVMVMMMMVMTKNGRRSKRNDDRDYKYDNPLMDLSQIDLLLPAHSEHASTHLLPQKQ